MNDVKNVKDSRLMGASFNYFGNVEYFQIDSDGLPLQVSKGSVPGRVRRVVERQLVQREINRVEFAWRDGLINFETDTHAWTRRY